MRERQFPHPQSGRIELNLDLSLCPSTLRKRDGLLSQQERRDKKVEQNSCFRSRETKQRNSEKNTENLRKKKKKGHEQLSIHYPLGKYVQHIIQPVILKNQ